MYTYTYMYIQVSGVCSFSFFFFFYECECTVPQDSFITQLIHRVHFIILPKYTSISGHRVYLLSLILQLSRKVGDDVFLRAENLTSYKSRVSFFISLRPVCVWCVCVYMCVCVCVCVGEKETGNSFSRDFFYICTVEGFGRKERRGLPRALSRTRAIIIKRADKCDYRLCITSTDLGLGELRLLK